MPFFIETFTSTGPVSDECTTAADTMAKVLDFEQRPHGAITVKNSRGQVINIDELTRLVEIELKAKK